MALREANGRLRAVRCHLALNDFLPIGELSLRLRIRRVLLCEHCCLLRIVNIHVDIRWRQTKYRMLAKHDVDRAASKQRTKCLCPAMIFSNQQTDAVPTRIWS